MDEATQANAALAEATAKFEALFTEVLMGKPSRISQTGEEYTEVTNDGPSIEGEGWSVYDFLTDKRVRGATIHATATGAIEQWLESATKIASPLLESRPALYWRIKPEIDYGHFELYATNGLCRVPTWKVYSRFLISSKPRTLSDSAQRLANKLDDIVYNQGTGSSLGLHDLVENQPKET